jgi:hypothetical protein
VIIFGRGLVARMVNDKVPARVLRMKLYSCHAGGAGSESFAKTMRLAMNEPFPHSDLYAYTGTVTPKRKLYAHPATHLVRGEFHRASPSRIRLARPLPFMRTWLRGSRLSIES